MDNAIEKTHEVVDQVRTVKRRVMIDRFTSGLPGGVAPDGWVSSELGSLARVNPEQLGSKTDPDYLMEYLDIAAIEQPGFIGGGRTLRFAEAPSRARRVVRNGDILVSTVRPYLRNFAHVREAKGNLIASTGYAVVRPGEGVDGGYLYQKIMSPEFVEYLKTRMAGSNYPAVTAHDVGSYRLSLPPRSEQRKIAAILSSVDNTIEKTKAIVDQVQVVKHGVMNDLFTRGLPCGTAPGRWESSDLGSLARVNPEQLGGRTDPDYLMEYLDIAAIEQPGFIGGGRTLRFAEAPSRARRVVRNGDILVSTVRPYLRNFAHVREAKGNPIASTGYAVVRPGKGVDGGYLYQKIMSPDFVEYLKMRMSGSNYPAVTAHDVGSYRLSFPSPSEQRKIAAILSSMDAEIETSIRSVHRLQTVKTALTSVLLTGELRVTPDTAFTDAMDIVNLEAPGRDRVSHRASG